MTTSIGIYAHGKRRVPVSLVISTILLAISLCVWVMSVLFYFGYVYAFATSQRAGYYAITCSDGCVRFVQGHTVWIHGSYWLCKVNWSDADLQWIPIIGETDNQNLTVTAIPLWAPFAGITAAAVVVWGRHGWGSVPGFCCQRCGYNLTGNVSGMCPECGTPIANGERR
jgi:hypothetical protein